MRIHLLRHHDVNPPHWYGVSRYATEMVAAIKRHDPAVEMLAFHASLRGRLPEDRRRALEHAGVELRPARWPNLSRWTVYNRLVERCFVPRLVAQAGCDLSWGTNCVALPKRRGTYRTVVTIHDLFLLTHPELSESHFADVVGPRLRRTAHEVDLVLTDSRFTQSQIVDRLDVEPSKVVVTTLGASATLLRADAELGEASAEHRDHRSGESTLIDSLAQPPPSEFLLSVGTVEPRKNYQRGLEVYRLLQQRLPQMPPWLIVGRDGWKFKAFYAAREQMHLESQVRVLSGVNDEQLAALYRRARCLFCPSLVEGFGLAVAEAMHVGTPVVSSTGGALPEVGGDAVLAAEPTDTEALAHALQRVLTDPDLAADLVRRGRLRAQDFTWDRGAREALEAFNRLLRV